MPRVVANGISFHYLDEGSGTPLVLLGGTLGSAREDFTAQFAHFAPRMRVVAPDRRGYGDTRPPSRDFPDDFYAREARDMAAWCAALDLPPAIVCGWSEGAAVACWLAALAPERVSALVLWGGIERLTAEDIASFEARRDTHAWSPRARAGMDRVYGTDGYWDAVWGAWIDVMRRLYAQGGDPRLAPLEDLAAPTLILHGSRDALIREAQPRALAARMPNARLQFIEGGGHNVHASHADAFNQALSRFIDALAVPPPGASANQAALKPGSPS